MCLQISKLVPFLTSYLLSGLVILKVLSINYYSPLPQHSSASTNSWYSSSFMNTFCQAWKVSDFVTTPSAVTSCQVQTKDPIQMASKWRFSSFPTAVWHLALHRERNIKLNLSLLYLFSTEIKLHKDTFRAQSIIRHKDRFIWTKAVPSPSKPWFTIHSHNFAFWSNTIQWANQTAWLCELLSCSFF